MLTSLWPHFFGPPCICGRRTFALEGGLVEQRFGADVTDGRRAERDQHELMTVELATALRRRLALRARPQSQLTRSTQPCIPLGSLNRVPASAGGRAGMSPLPGGRQHCVIPCGMWVPVAVWQPCELLYVCYLLTYLLTRFTAKHDVSPPRCQCRFHAIACSMRLLVCS